VIPGFTSTQSKRPQALFGDAHDVPTRMLRANGCTVWDSEGREYLDTVMALGAVGLGYGHPAVTVAATDAVRDGVVGPLPPVLEEEVAERLSSILPLAESTRFLKTGAEAMAAAVRIARAETGREAVITCGYHGWLDWCQDSPGVPRGDVALHRKIVFNDISDLERVVSESEPLAAIVVEPVIEAEPSSDWLRALRRMASSAGAVLIFDEIKTAFRLDLGGATEHYGVSPDLVVLGKALGNGFPIAAVCGGRDLMETAARTWISSTLATEYVSLAAARAVIDTYLQESVVEQIAIAGEHFFRGVVRLQAEFHKLITGVVGIPQMFYLGFHDEQTSGAVARAAVRHGLIFKRTAYNFMSLAHTETIVDEVLVRLASALAEVDRTC
jgi:glutamate-1-semialdehyde 2,1-aminomutase